MAILCEVTVAPPVSASDRAARAAAGGGRLPRCRIAPYADCVAYANLVVEVLKKDRAKVAEFRKVMQDYKTNRIGDLAELVSRVTDILRGHPELMLAGFKAFLPVGFKVTGGGGAGGLWNLVKKVLKDDNEKLNQFVEILKDSSARRIDTAEATSRVMDVFRGIPLLMLAYLESVL